MSLKDPNFNDFMAAIQGMLAKGVPEHAKAHLAWYNKISMDITAYAVAVGTNMVKLSKDPNYTTAVTPELNEMYSHLCDSLLQGLPANGQISAENAFLKERLNTAAKALLTIAFRDGWDKLDLTHEEINAARKMYSSIGIADCKEHGIHVDAVAINGAAGHVAH